MITRAFLQGLPEQRKRGAADATIAHHVTYIQDSAALGKTSYMFEPDNRSHNVYHQTNPNLTADDLVAAFQRKFPDCTVSYQETWVDVNATNRVLKRGIVIDWS
jgi:alanine racemase